MAKNKRTKNPFRSALQASLQSIRRRITKPLTRQNAAYFLMFAFVLCTSVGAFNIYAPAGWVTLGVTSGLFGYILGSE